MLGLKHSLNGDPQSYHLENLAEKIRIAQTDATMYAEITDEELEILRIEVNAERHIKEWSENNVRPF